MPNGTTLTSKPKGTLSAYEPGLRDKIAWALSDMFGGDKSQTNYINEKVRGAVDLAPVLGDIIGAEDTKRAFNAGNYGEAAVNAGTTLVGSVPGVGDAAAAGLKAGAGAAGILAPKAGKWLEMFHGTHSPLQFDELGTGFSNPAVANGLLPDVGIHVTPDPHLASVYAGMDNEMPSPRMAGGRVYPVLANKGRVFRGDPKEGTEIRDISGWVDPDSLEESFDNAVWGDLPHAKEILADALAGLPLDQAIKRRGFDSMDYLHTSPRHHRDREVSATMLTDPKQIVPRFSEKGLTLNSKMGRKPSFPIDQYDMEFWNDPERWKK